MQCLPARGEPTAVLSVKTGASLFVVAAQPRPVGLRICWMQRWRMASGMAVFAWKQLALTPMLGHRTKMLEGPGAIFAPLYTTAELQRFQTGHGEQSVLG